MLREMRLIPRELMLVDPEIDIGHMTNLICRDVEVEIVVEEADNIGVEVISIMGTMIIELFGHNRCRLISSL